MLKFNERRYFHSPERTGKSVANTDLNIQTEIQSSKASTSSPEGQDSVAESNKPHTLAGLQKDPQLALEQLAQPEEAAFDQDLAEGNLREGEYSSEEMSEDNINKFFTTLEQLQAKKDSELTSTDMIKLAEAYKASGGEIDLAELHQVLTELHEVKQESGDTIADKLNRQKTTIQKWASFCLKNGIPLGAAGMALAGGPFTALVVGLSARYYMGLRMKTDSINDKQKFQEVIANRQTAIENTWKKCVQNSLAIFNDINKYKSKLASLTPQDSNRSQIIATITALEDQFKDVLKMARDSAVKLSENISMIRDDRETEQRLRKLASSPDQSVARKAVNSLRTQDYKGSQISKYLSEKSAFTNMLEKSGLSSPELDGTKSITGITVQEESTNWLEQDPEEGFGLNAIRQMREAYNR